MRRDKTKICIQFVTIDKDLGRIN